MLIDGIALSEGSALQNLTVASGASFPADANAGELFFSTTLSALCVYTGAAWATVSTLVDSKIPVSQLPSLAITDVFAVGDQASMLALNAQRGDVAIRSDLNKTFILSADTPSVLSAWLEVLVPTGVAATATKLATARNIALTGDVVGTASFDGSADATIAVTLKGDIVSTKTFTGSVTCNYLDGSYVVANVTGATSLSLSGVPDSTKAYGMTFELTNAGTNITWPASVVWLGTAPTLRASGVSMVTLVTRNGGTTWYGSAA
jgi:hypothetical protein